jgi:cysteine-rich repeat protein
VVCGNGVVEGDEACDDGNRFDDDACNNACQRSSCGDGVVSLDSESCDDGNRIDNDACRNDCSHARCGDGVQRTDLGPTAEGYEGCDDGNESDSDGCLAGCVEARCGDGVQRLDTTPESPLHEACDDGNDSETDACTTRCVAARCGDGIQRTDLEPDEVDYEACDDGNSAQEDACTNTCAQARCGDGITRNDLQPSEPGSEACDDANLIEADACTNTCRAARCGDGVQRLDLNLGQPGYEACDDGNDNDSDGCSNRCTTPACGNGDIEAAEECDDGNRVDEDNCRNSCVLAACGDGVTRVDLAEGVRGFEACDDGNRINNDGCLNNCVPARCGDSVRRTDLGQGEAGYEACDDGNEDPADACFECRNTCAQHSNCPGAFGRCRVAPDAQRGTCYDLRHHRCQNDDGCIFTDAQGEETDTVCDGGLCRVDEFSACIDSVACAHGNACHTVNNTERCLQPCQNHQQCRSRFTRCDVSVGNHCWYNLCGSPNELSQGFQQINNGRLGGACAGDHDNPQDGHCIEISVGQTDWVGMCFEGGTLAERADCTWGAARTADAQQCGGGMLCTGYDQAGDQHCRSTCSAPGEHGSVTCGAGHTCMPSLSSATTYSWACIPALETCDVLARSSCGNDGRCTVLLTHSTTSHCTDLAPVNERVNAGEQCTHNNQCADGYYCNTQHGCRRLCATNTDCDGTDRCSRAQDAAFGGCEPPNP